MNESTLVPREELSDLDWLARNVHKWPAGDHQPWCYVYMTYGGVMKAAGNVLDAVANPTMITIEQWLARRAELQNKPSWDACPEWAQWLAQDADGCWHWFKGNIKPEIQSDNKTWSNKYASFHKVDYGKTGGVFAGKGSVLGFCNDTLEKRPEKLQPFTSIEDNQEKSMKQDDGWFESGDLPPVGIAVQLWHGGTYAYDCELIAKRGNDFVLWNLTWDRPDSADCMMCIFKPIPTEREVLIEIIKKTDDTDDKIADAILAAGFSLEAK